MLCWKIETSVRPSVDRLVGRLVALTFIISQKVGNFHFHAPIGAHVFILCVCFVCREQVCGTEKMYFVLCTVLSKLTCHRDKVILKLILSQRQKFFFLLIFRRKIVLDTCGKYSF